METGLGEAIGEEREEISALGRCTRLHALTADRNVKFRSSPAKAGRFTAEIATRNTEDFE